MKALLPYGYMPAVSGDGKVEIVICTLEGQKSVFVDKNNAPTPPSEHDSNYNATCPYSILNISAYPENIPDFSHEITYKKAVFISLRALKILSTHENFYLSRGPPSLSIN